MKTKLCQQIRAIVILIFSICLIPVSSVAMDYDHEIKLKKMSFSWKIQQDQLFVKLVAEAKGWVGIGFNPTKKMQDANFIIGYVKNGKVEITDAFGVRPKEHINDSAMNGSNDITAVSGSEQGGTTTIEFAIPLNSGDSADRKIDTGDITTVLLAFGKGRDDFHSKHRFRTRIKVNLSTGMQK